MSVNLNKLEKISLNSNLFYKSFLGRFIKKGKREKFLKIFIKSVLLLKEIYEDKDILIFFMNSLIQIRPVITLKVKKVGASSYELPYPVSEKRAIKMVITWFFRAVVQRTENSLEKRIVFEIIDILEKKGYTINQKILLEKTALKNRPYIHYLKR